MYVQFDFLLEKTMVDKSQERNSTAFKNISTHFYYECLDMTVCSLSIYSNLKDIQCTQTPFLRVTNIKFLSTVSINKSREKVVRITDIIKFKFL